MLQIRFHACPIPEIFGTALMVLAILNETLAGIATWVVLSSVPHMHSGPILQLGAGVAHLCCSGYLGY